MRAYSDKLRDPRWQKRRLEILARDNFQCQDCGTTEKTLHVHHCVYLRGKEPWEYLDEDFRTLCEDCHDIRGGLEHDVVLEFRRFLAAKNAEELRGIMDCFMAGGAYIAIPPPDFAE